MRYSEIVAPLVVFALAATGSLLGWLTMPADLAAEVGVQAFADTNKVIGAYMLAIVSFCLGLCFCVSLAWRAVRYCYVSTRCNQVGKGFTAHWVFLLGDSAAVQSLAGGYRRRP
jgi:hypothetical protein